MIIKDVKNVVCLFYSVSQGFRLMKWDDYFWVIFKATLIFWDSWDSSQKLARALNQTTILNFIQVYVVKIHETHFTGCEQWRFRLRHFLIWILISEG